jgi:riboflavin synthase
VCLTVVEATGGSFSADVMAETLRRTSLGTLAPGAQVNLERPMPADGRFGGHIVQGHVDGVGRIRRRAPSEHWELVEVSLPASLARYVVPKGSIAVDGVSLTVVDVLGGDDPRFTVSLIPTTLSATTLGHLAVGSR